MTSDPQKLVDFCFEVGLMIHTEEWFKGKTTDQVAEWIADQLEQCGFETTPVGASHGVLVKR